MYVSCDVGSSSKSGSYSTCLVRTRGSRAEGTGVGVPPESTSVVVVAVAVDGIDHMTAPVVLFNAWNFPSTEATRTMGKSSRSGSFPSAPLSDGSPVKCRRAWVRAESRLRVNESATLPATMSKRKARG